MNAYSQGFLDQYSIVRRVIGDAYIEFAVITGSISLLLSILAALLYVRYRHRIGTSLPCLLIIFSAIIVVGVMLSRFPQEGPMYSLNDRYQRLSVLGFFGTLWILSVLCLPATAGGSSGTKDKGRFILIALVICVLLVNALSNAVRWRSIPLEKNRLDTMAGGIAAFTENPEIDIYKFLYNRHCYSDDCENAVYYLKKT